MSTALVLGNGNLLVNINHNLNISDLYWPHVGQENHLAKLPNQMFIKVGDQFSDFARSEWNYQIGYQNNSLNANSKITSAKYALEMQIQDCVLPDTDIFFRIFKFTNLASYAQTINFYLKNNFYILEDDIGNTAQWYPKAQTICHYKKDRYIALGSNSKIYQYTCAGPQDNNHQGAFPDQISGELKFNPVATGSAQSCISYKFELAAQSSVTVDSFILCASNFTQVKELAKFIHSQSLTELYAMSDRYWNNWLNSKIDEQMFHKSFNEVGHGHLGAQLLQLYNRSLLILRTQFDNDGAVIAANDTTFIKTGGKDAYCYFWPRDGAFSAIAMIESGHVDIVKKTFDFCKQALTSGGYLMHKYYPDIKSGIGSSWHPWIDQAGNFQLPIQEDETALIIYSIGKFYEYTKDLDYIKTLWEQLIKPAADFLYDYRYGVKSGKQYQVSELEQKQNPIDLHFQNSHLPMPSYDIWEHDRGVYTYTVATVYAGLTAAAAIAEVLGYKQFTKVYNLAAEEIKNDVLKFLVDEEKHIFITGIKCNATESKCQKVIEADSSLAAIWFTGMFAVDHPLVKNTMQHIEKTLWLKTSIGGIARKQNDKYLSVDDDLPGNPWFISTLWLAQYWIKSGQIDLASKYLNWVIEHVDFTGLIAEQAHPYFGTGLSSKPLSWSHAELINTVNILNNYFKQSHAD